MTHPSTPIAIIGAGCHFPGGRDLESFFRFVLDGGCAIRELPAHRYDRELYYDPKKGAPGKSYCWNGAMLDTRTFATPVAPVLSPDAAARLHPLQKLALGVAAETFASAGLDPAQLVGRDIPVILGGGRPSIDTFDRAFAHAIDRLVAPLGDAMSGDPRASEIRAEIVRHVHERYGGNADEPWPALLGRQVAGVVANAYGLTGRHAVIDAACASTLAAMAVGKRALEQGAANMVLVGAASLFDPYTLVLFAQSRALTHDHSYPFDARATGFIPGEGSGMFLLERLEDALANGRNILGVIRALGSSCDGSGKGTWAPRKEGQVLAIERAYATGQVDLSEVQVVEAHATSTKLGDATEVAALGEVFGRKPRKAPILIGSVKGNMGHGLSAAGAAGLSKILGALRHGTLPPSIGYTSPNSDIHWDRVPLRIAATATPWPSDGPRVAALDSFGIGGLNYHAVIEGPPTSARAQELLRKSVAAPRAQVAIVGAGAFLPGARSTDEVARVVASGSGQFRRLPASRLALDVYHHAGAPARWRTRISEAAVADDPKPDPAQLKIPPKLISNYDPLQFIVLDAATQALAGIKRQDAIDKKRVAVFVGSSQISDFFIELVLAVRVAELSKLVENALAARGIDGSDRARILASFVERARQLLPTVTEESSASVASGLSSRPAKSIDVNGPVFTIDAGGTSSSLAALEAGVEALVAGDCDIAVVGGGDRALRIDRLALWDELAGSPSDLPGEGATMVALRRLDDAVAAGDTVLATVAGVGSSTSGSFARARRPDRDSVERAVSRAFSRASVEPAKIQYAVSDGDAQRKGDVRVDSPLPVFGHCDGATGMASLQIALGALPRLRAAGDAAVAVTSAGPWGSHYHVVLAGQPAAGARVAAGAAVTAPAVAGSAATREPIVFRAASRAALWSVLQPLRGTDLSRFSPGQTIGSGPAAVALRASSLKESLEVALTALTSPESASFAAQGVAIAEAPVAPGACFLFPGLGSPYEGMLSAAVEAYPAAARRLAEIDALVKPFARRTMSDVLEREPRLFAETVEWAQFASLTANLVTYEVAAAHGFVPAFVSGHSFGEYAALVVAGAISLESAVKLAVARAECLARSTRPGAMTSVFASRARIAELLKGLPGFAAASNVNSPEEVVVSGDREGTAAFLERCRQENVQARQLTVPAPFHCELLRSACEPFARAIAQVPIAAPKIPVVSSVTSREISDPEEIRRALVEQLVKPVDWISQIEYAYGRGVRRFIETGAGNVLSRLTAKIVGRREAVIVSFDERRKREKTGVAAVENALVVLRASEDRSQAQPQAQVAAAAVVATAPAASEPSALFTPEEWRELAKQPDWAAFWVQARPSLALFARDLYARSRPAGAPAVAVAAVPSVAPAAPAEPPRPQVKMFDTTTMRRTERAPAPPPAPAPVPAAPVPATALASAPAADPSRLVEEVSGLLVDLVVKHTGYPRDLVRFEQELEADLGIDTVKQVELLGTIREQLDLAADESVTVSDLPTLAQLRDYVVRRLSTTERAPAAAPAAPAAAKPAPVDTGRLADEVGGFLVDLVVKYTGYPRDLVRFEQELEADLGIDTVKQVELLGTIREQLDLPADESVTVSDLPTLGQLRDYVIRKLAGAARPEPQAAAPSGAPSTGDLVAEVSRLLTELVVKHTGYPSELVRFEQELEADLGIDTVKQVELLGTIRERLDLPADESITVSDLPTLAQLRDYVIQRMSTLGRTGGGTSRPRSRTPRRHASSAHGVASDDEEPAGEGPGESALGERIDVATLPGVSTPPARLLVDVAEDSRRFVPRPRLEPLAPSTTQYRPARVVLVGDGTPVDDLAAAFAARGIAITRASLDAPRDLAALFAGDPIPDLCLASAVGRVPATPEHLGAPVMPLLDATRMERLVELVRAWLRRAGSSQATLSALTSLGGFCGHGNLTGASLEGAGLVGMLRALRHEHPSVRFKAVDVDAWAAGPEIAAALLAELHGSSRKLWAGWFRGERRVPRLVPTRPPRVDDERLARLRTVPYVLVTGGARGITAELALRLAEVGVARLHLVGRTALPADLSRWQALAGAELRERVLEDLRASGRTVGPAEWNQAVARIEAALEIDRNIRRIEAAGAQVRYHAADIGDRQRVAELLAAIRSADGPIRAVVHGAGTQRSRALLTKPLSDFTETLAPKLAGAVHLMELTADDPIEFFACFSSVAGQFGNQGQTDYGLASTALDALAATYAKAHPARRVFSIAWPAWDEVGMAVRGGTREQLERRGRRLMSVAEGGNHFVRELVCQSDDSVVTIAGPTIGDPDEQRPTPQQLEALDAAVRAAAALPLVDEVTHRDEASIEIEVHADAARDAFLRDHVLGDVALLPGVAMLEMLAEVASVAGGARVDVLENVAIANPFKLPLRGRGTVHGHARADGDGFAVRLTAPHVDRAGRSVEAERLLVSAHARRRTNGHSPLSWREVAGRVVPYKYRTPAECGPTRVLHGESLRALDELVVGDHGWHAARLRALPARALRPSAGEWCVPAALLDGCLAACGALLGMRGLTGLPSRFGRIELPGVPRDHEECRMLVHQRSHDEREVHFDFAAWGADGRLLFSVEDFVWRSFAAIPRDAIRGAYM